MESKANVLLGLGHSPGSESTKFIVEMDHHVAGSFCCVFNSYDRLNNPLLSHINNYGQTNFDSIYMVTIYALCTWTGIESRAVILFTDNFQRDSFNFDSVQYFKIFELSSTFPSI